MIEKLAPVHPGEVLREGFLVPMKLSGGMLTRVVHAPRTRTERLTNKQITLTTDPTAAGQCLRRDPASWMTLSGAEDELGRGLTTPIHAMRVERTLGKHLTASRVFRPWGGISRLRGEAREVT